MSSIVPFSQMPPDAREFYERVFNNVLLNAYAVRRGLFDILFCETDDPAVMKRWRRERPRIIEVCKLLRARDLEQPDLPGE